jgi:hypothetical protein
VATFILFFDYCRYIYLNTSDTTFKFSLPSLTLEDKLPNTGLPRWYPTIKFRGLLGPQNILVYSNYSGHFRFFSPVTCPTGSYYYTNLTHVGIWCYPCPLWTSPSHPSVLISMANKSADGCSACPSNNYALYPIYVM